MNTGPSVSKEEIEQAMNPKPKESPTGLYFNPISGGKYRNMSCPCASGKKVKKCHGIKSGLNKSELTEVNDLIRMSNQATVEVQKEMEDNLNNDIDIEIERIDEQIKEREEQPTT